MRLSPFVFLLLLALPLGVLCQSDQNELMCSINNARVSGGLSALGPNSDLDSAAYVHSQDMGTMDSLSHTGSDGSDPQQRMQLYGFQGTDYTENIGFAPDATTVMNMWLASSAHLANIMDPDACFVGIGIYTDSTGMNWYTTDFGGDGGSYSFQACQASSGVSLTVQV